MPTFDTPGPITATIDVLVGAVRISAGDPGAAVVDVRPSDASNEEDVKAAEQTRAEYANEQLLVRSPKLRSWLPRSRAGSVDVTCSRSIRRPIRSLLGGRRYPGLGGITHDFGVAERTLTQRDSTARMAAFDVDSAAGRSCRG
jgi:hypothetical protein